MIVTMVEMNYYIHFVTDLLLNWLMPEVLESTTATIVDVDVMTR